MTDFPGLLDFYVADASTRGVVVGWIDGYLVVMTDERTLARISPWSSTFRVVGKATLTLSDDDVDETPTEAKRTACA